MSNRFEATSYEFTPFNPVQNWILKKSSDFSSAELYGSDLTKTELFDRQNFSSLKNLRIPF